MQCLKYILLMLVLCCLLAEDDIEYDQLSVKLKDGKLLTPKGFTEGVLKKFGIEMPEDINISQKGVDVTGLKGYIAVTTVSLALGKSATVYVSDGSLVIRYRREDVEKVKEKLAKGVSVLLVRLFRAEEERRTIPEIKTYGVYPVGRHEKGRQPLLMVHGLDSSDQSFNDLADVLDAKELYNLYVFQYKNDQAIARTALELSFAITRIESDSTFICTHSMGGLVVREYITNPEIYRKNVSRFLMIAPPNHGSNLARLRFVLDLGEGFTLIHDEHKSFREALAALIEDGLGKAGDDLQPGSLFLDRLSKRKIPEGIATGIITGDRGLVTEQQHKKLVEWLTNKEKNVDSPYAQMVFQKLKKELGECVEIIHGKGDMAVSLESARLDEAGFFKKVDKNHLNILAGDESNPVFKMIEEFFAAEEKVE